MIMLGNIGIGIDICDVEKFKDIKNELLERNNVQTKLVSDKKTNYNSEMYMDECSVCGDKFKLETHHINFQKDFINQVLILIWLSHHKNVYRNCIGTNSDCDRDIQFLFTFKGD